MRVLILLILIGFSIVKGISQSIDQSWFLKSGVKFAQLHTFDPDLSGMSLDQFGKDQVWDFSKETLNGFVDTTWFLEPSEMIFKEHFPTANLARRNLNPLYDWEWFYRIEADTMFKLGEAYIRHVGNSIDTFIQTLPTGVEHIHAYNGYSLGDQFWDSDDDIEGFTFQGFGTLITSPSDTFENTILIRRNFVPTGSVRYYWYQGDFTREVCYHIPPNQIVGTSSLARMVYYQDNNISSNQNPILNKLKDLTFAYREGQVVISNHSDPKDVRLSIYSIDGKQLSKSNLKLLTGDNYHSLVNNSQHSILVVLCVDQNSDKFFVQKIFVE